MGLDMNLTGVKSYTTWGDDCIVEDGFPLDAKHVRLGYWRKHPNLHGYIVKTFAGGVDECQQIELGEDEIEKIIAAVKADELPPTDGFFFGVSHGPNEQNTIGQFEKALEWLKRPKDKGEMFRYIFYRASW